MATKKASDFEKDLGRHSGKTKGPPVKPHAKEPPPQLRGKKKDR